MVIMLDLDWSVLRFKDPSWPWPIFLSGEEGIHQRQFISEDELLSWDETHGSYSMPLVCEQYTQTLAPPQSPKWPIITSCPSSRLPEDHWADRIWRVKEKQWPPVYYNLFDWLLWRKRGAKTKIIRCFGTSGPLSELKLFLHAAWIPSGLPTTLSETKCSLL